MIPPTRPAADAPGPDRDKINRALRNKGRLDAIERTALIDSAHEIPPLNRAIRLAAKALNAPVAQINVLTDKALVPIAVFTEGEEDRARWSGHRPVGKSYCKYVVCSKQLFQVDDARAHPTVRNSYATRELGIAAYLAVPIRASMSGTSEPQVVGTVCVVDFVPREWSEDDVQTLSDLALGVSDLIAARIRTRAQVHASEKQAERVLEAMGVAVLVTDAEGVTTFANSAAARMLGYTAEELTGHDQHALIHHTRLDGSRSPEVECENYRARKAGKVNVATNDTYWRSDGQSIEVDSTMTPIFERGEVIGTVLTFIDVSERRASETTERAGRIAAEAANHAKTEMLAAISHELRIPLTAIAERMQRLESGLVDVATAEQRDDLRGIQRSQQHLLGLLANVVHFSTIEVPGKV